MKKMFLRGAIAVLGLGMVAGLLVSLFISDHDNFLLICVLSSVKKGSVIAFKKLLLPLLFSPITATVSAKPMSIFLKFL